MAKKQKKIERYVQLGIDFGFKIAIITLQKAAEHSPQDKESILKSVAILKNIEKKFS